MTHLMGYAQADREMGPNFTEDAAWKPPVNFTEAKQAYQKLLTEIHKVQEETTREIKILPQLASLADPLIEAKVNLLLAMRKQLLEMSQQRHQLDNAIRTLPGVSKEQQEAVSRYRVDSETGIQDLGQSFGAIAAHLTRFVDANAERRKNEITLIVRSLTS